MTEQTKALMMTIFKSDPTITPDQTKSCILVLSGAYVPVRDNDVCCQIVSREEAARMMGIGPKRVDDFSRMGALKRVYFPGSVRASGILRSSIDELITKGVR